MIVLTENGDAYTLAAISACPTHGPVAHDIGAEGSLSCQPCGAEADARSMRREGEAGMTGQPDGTLRAALEALCDAVDLQDSQDAGKVVTGTVTTSEVRAVLAAIDAATDCPLCGAEIGGHRHASPSPAATEAGEQP